LFVLFNNRKIEVYYHNFFCKLEVVMANQNIDGIIGHPGQNWTSPTPSEKPEGPAVPIEVVTSKLENLKKSGGASLSERAVTLAPSGETDEKVSAKAKDIKPTKTFSESVDEKAEAEGFTLLSPQEKERKSGAMWIAAGSKDWNGGKVTLYAANSNYREYNAFLNMQRIISPAGELHIDDLPARYPFFAEGQVNPALMKASALHYRYHPKEIDVGKQRELFLKLGYRTIIDENKNVFLQVPDHIALQNSWKQLQKEHPKLPDLNIDLSEGIAEDKEFAESMTSNSALMSEGREAFHDHVIHLIPTIARKLSYITSGNEEEARATGEKYTTNEVQFQELLKNNLKLLERTRNEVQLIRNGSKNLPDGVSKEEFNQVITVLDKKDIEHVLGLNADERTAFTNYATVECRLVIAKPREHSDVNTINNAITTMNKLLISRLEILSELKIDRNTEQEQLKTERERLSASNDGQYHELSQHEIEQRKHRDFNLSTREEFIKNKNDGINEIEVGIKSEAKLFSHLKELKTKNEAMENLEGMKEKMETDASLALLENQIQHYKGSLSRFKQKIDSKFAPKRNEIFELQENIRKLSGEFEKAEGKKKQEIADKLALLKTDFETNKIDLENKEKQDFDVEIYTTIEERYNKSLTDLEKAIKEREEKIKLNPDLAAKLEENLKEYNQSILDYQKLNKGYQQLVTNNNMSARKHLLAFDMRTSYGQP